MFQLARRMMDERAQRRQLPKRARCQKTDISVTWSVDRRDEVHMPDEKSRTNRVLLQGVDQSIRSVGHTHDLGTCTLNEILNDQPFDSSAIFMQVI